jgi:hypothetical protein
MILIATKRRKSQTKTVALDYSKAPVVTPREVVRIDLSYPMKVLFISSGRSWSL